MSLYQSSSETSESSNPRLQDEDGTWVPTERPSCRAAGPSTVSRAMCRPSIKVFVSYESDLNRDRAQFMQEELSRRLGRSFNFIVSWWSIKSLERPEIRRDAARSVAEADIICFSLSSGAELPEHVTKWLEKRLVGRKARKLCLLALVETGGLLTPRLSRAEIYLSQLSLAAGVDCLCYSDSIHIPRSIRSKGCEPAASLLEPSLRIPMHAFGCGTRARISIDGAKIRRGRKSKSVNNIHSNLAFLT